MTAGPQAPSIDGDQGSKLKDRESKKSFEFSVSAETLKKKSVKNEMSNCDSESAIECENLRLDLSFSIFLILLS